MSNENMVYEKIEKIPHDKEFMEKMSSATTASEIQSLLKEKGIEVSEAEAQQIIDKTNELTQESVDASGKMDEKALEEIVGGVSVKEVAKKAAKGVAAVTAIVFVLWGGNEIRAKLKEKRKEEEEKRIQLEREADPDYNLLRP